MTQELWQSRGIKRFLLLAASAIFTWHMAAITLPQMPRNSGFGTKFHDFFALYLRMTGSWGAWEMFTTIPYYNYLSVELSVLESNKTNQTVGAMLPDFQPMDQHIRIMLYFLRLVWTDNLTQVYRDTYIQKACDSYQKKFGGQPLSIKLVANSIRLHSLVNAAQNGVMGEPQTYERGPFPCSVQPIISP